jgi:hypothetical protein
MGLFWPIIKYTVQRLATKYKKLGGNTYIMNTLKLIRPNRNFISGINLSTSLRGTRVFAFCSEPSKNKTIRIKSELVSCRDYLCGCLEKKFRGIRNYKNIPIGKTRLLIASSTQSLNDKVMNETVRFLNVLERQHKWTKTVVRKVDFAHCVAIERMAKKEMVMYALFSSPKWIRSSHMVSLYALIVRLCTFSSSLRSIKTYEDFLSYVKKSNSGIFRDTFARTSLPYVDIIMKNFNELFKGTTIESNYMEEVKKYNYEYSGDMANYGEGIMRLTQCTPRNNTLGNRFKDILKREKEIEK